MMDTLDTTSSPNFSIILPGECNAQCDFCFWKYEKSLDHHDYFTRLDKILKKMPKQFDKISLTGGEPTISPLFSQIIERLRYNKSRWSWNKVVLTTNGSFLFKDKIDLIKGCVDYVNISRHAVEDTDNYKVFGTEQVPTRKELRLIIRELNKAGIEATVNCVETEYLTRSFIPWAKSCGFSKICFRKPHAEGCNLYPSTWEHNFSEYNIVWESSCPVCRSASRIVEGMEIIWTSSIPEPSLGLNLIYEAVFHPDGSLTADWGKRLHLHF
jgi:hypothetical protein